MKQLGMLIALAGLIVAPIPAFGGSRPGAVELLIEQWTAQNSLCRGGSGDKPETQKACEERQETGRALDALNWCYGTKTQMAYEMEWHRCKADSNRYE